MRIFLYFYCFLIIFEIFFCKTIYVYIYIFLPVVIFLYFSFLVSKATFLVFLYSFSLFMKNGFVGLVIRNVISVSTNAQWLFYFSLKLDSFHHFQLTFIHLMQLNRPLISFVYNCIRYFA